MASDAARVRDASGGPCGSIWLFDTAAGGAGYAGTATSDVAGLLKEALGALDCANPGCERACPACLVLRDTARFADRLDRQAARTWLTGLVGSLVLPAGARVFDGGENIMARVPLPAELSRALDDDPVAALTLFLPGTAAGWDLEKWWALPIVERLAREVQHEAFARPQHDCPLPELAPRSDPAHEPGLCPPGKRNLVPPGIAKRYAGETIPEKSSDAADRQRFAEIQSYSVPGIAKLPTMA